MLRQYELYGFAYVFNKIIYLNRRIGIQLEEKVHQEPQKKKTIYKFLISRV